MDIINDGILWQHMINAIRWHKGPTKILRDEIWTDGDELLVSSEDTAYAIADFFDILGFDSHVGYYDPDEDARNNETDDHTGWWYIALD